MRTSQHYPPTSNSKMKPNPAFAVDPGTRRVTTGRNGERWTRAILPVSAHDINESVRANI